MPIHPDPLISPVAALLDHLTKPAAERRRRPGKLPYFMTIADGRQVFLTEEITSAIHTIAEALWSEDETRAVLHTRDEWRKLAQEAITAALRAETLAADRSIAIATMSAELRDDTASAVVHTLDLRPRAGWPCPGRSDRLSVVRSFGTVGLWI